MNIRQQVLDFLRSNTNIPYTNGDIAHELSLPEPSVRRATLQLEKSNAIHFYGEGSFGRNLWMA